MGGSDVLALGAAGLALAFSVYLWFSGFREEGMFVGLTKTVEGMPKDEILREAAAWGADRIVLGSHGRGRVDRFLLGSTAAGVAAEAPCSVHIARSSPAPDSDAALGRP